MADKKVNEIIDEVVEETVDETEEIVETTPVEEAESDEKKTTIKVPKWLVTTAKSAEAIAAIFGTVVAAFWIKDKVSKGKRRKRISAPAQDRLSDSHRSILESTESIGDDIKITNF